MTTPNTSGAADLPEALTADQWLDLAIRHANKDWNSAQPDGYANAVKALCADFAALTAQDPSQPGGFDAGDMASAAAQGFRDGLAAAQAISAEPAATQPAPHADSVRDYPPLPDFDSYDEPIWNAIFNWKTAAPGSEALRKANTVESVIINQLRAYVDADRAARAPADSVTAPGGGVVAAGRFMDEAAERRSAQEGYENRIRRVSERNPHDEGMYSLGWWDRAWKAAAPTSPAQAADSVPENAARYRYLRDGVIVDGEVNEDLYVHIDHQSYPNRWALVGTELDAAVDAARAAQKEGEKP